MTPRSRMSAFWPSSVPRIGRGRRRRWKILRSLVCIRTGNEGKHIAAPVLASKEDLVGEETKETLIRQGNDDPLHATRKPSTAHRVDVRPAQVAELPTKEEIDRRDSEVPES